MIKQLLAKALMLAGTFLAINANAQSTHTIVVAPGGNLEFSPNAVTCMVGDTIRFFYGPSSSGSHPTVSTSGPVAIALHTLDGTTTEFKVVMTATGTVNYECQPHAGSGMVGTITVNPAAPLFVENFSYPNATQLSTLSANGWAQIATTATNPILVDSPGLVYAGYPQSNIGNKARIANVSGQDIGRVFPGANIRNNSVYTSFLLNISSVNATGDYIFAYLDSALNGTNFRARVFARSSGAGYRLGISKSGAVGVAGFNASDLNFNETYLVVVKYKILPGTANDSAMLYINPVLGASEPAASAIAVTSESDITISNTVGIGAFTLRQGSAANMPLAFIDGIKVARSWAIISEAAVIPPSVKFNPTTLTVNENAGTATVTVELTNANANATSVDVVVKGGSATAANDYTFTSQTVTFPANSTTAQSFTFPIIDDLTQEIDETIELVLRNNTNASTIEADSILTITIPANDIASPVVSISSMDTIQTAEGQSAVITLSITNENSNPTSVNLVMKSTSTANASDFSGIDSAGVTYTFPANSSASISDTVDITDDNIAEFNESIIFVLRNATNSALIGSDSVQTIIIAQNDQPLTVHFMGTTANVNENAGSVNVTIMAMGTGTSSPTSFDLAVKSSTATNGADYNFNTTTITVAAGEDSTIVIPVSILNDTDVETDEDIVLVIRNITNNGIISDSIYTLIIKSDDIASYTIAQIRENDANGNSLLTGSKVNIRGIVYGVDMQGSATSLQYTLIDPTAGVGIFRSGANNPPAITIVPVEGDSASVYGTVAEFNGLTQINMDSIIIISSGNALKQPRVITSLDETTESDLVLFRNAVVVDTIANTGSGTTVRIAAGTDSLDLRVDADVSLFNQGLPAKFNVVGLGGQFDNSNPKNSGYQLLPRYLQDVTAVVDPTVTLDSATYSVSEGGQSKTVLVKLSTPSNGTTTVNIAVTGGTATSSDFQLTGTGVVTFAHGETEKSVVFNINEDGIAENNETVNFALSNPVNAVLGTPSSAILTIVDNDVIGVNVSKIDGLSVYPNPAKDVLNIKANVSIQSVNILNTMGQVVYTAIVNANTTSIQVDGLSAGVYTVVINSDNAMSTQKLIIK